MATETSDSPSHLSVQAEPGPGDLSATLRELAWVIHRSAPERAGGPIPTTEIALLKQVIDAPGSTVGELASAIGLRQPNASAALRTLEARGFVRRTKSDEDRRVTLLMPTPEGIAEHEIVSEGWGEPVLEAIAALDPQHRAALDAAFPVLQQLQQHLKSRLRTTA